MSQTRYPSAVPAAAFCRWDRVGHSGELRVAAWGLSAERGTATFPHADVSAATIAIAVSRREMSPDLHDRELLVELPHDNCSIMVTTMEAFRSCDRDKRLAFRPLTGCAERNRCGSN
ncbi:MAG: hypothetical protein NVS4B6_03760 [Mycobacterium sp.]